MSRASQNNGSLAEQLGAGIAMNCLTALLATKNELQSGRVDIVQNAILQLSATTHPERAAGGFAVILDSVIVRGLEVQP